MDEVKAWFSSIGGNFCDLYAEDFALDGWDDMKSILLMSEADVKLLIPKPGHSARVWNAIQTLQSLSKQERQESDSERTSAAPVNRIPTYSQKSLPFCDGGEITIPGEKPWQRLNLWYPYPKQKRCMFSNEMLPGMYRAAYATLQTKFETYFCSEIAKRYERKQKVDKWVTFIDFKLSCINDAAYGKLLQLPARPQKDHIKQCQNAYAELEIKKADITSELEQVHTSYNNLFDSSGIVPRKWATEQISYESSIKEVLSNIIARLDSGIQHIKMTEKCLKDLFPHMASITRATKNRKIKEGRRKAKQRKTERLNATALSVLQTITSEDIVNLCFPEEHKSLGISQYYVTADQINGSALKKMLKKQRNLEALEKLRSLEVFSMDSSVLIESCMDEDED